MEYNYGGRFIIYYPQRLNERRHSKKTSDTETTPSPNFDPEHILNIFNPENFNSSKKTQLNPKLWILEYFSSVITEIDIQAEEILMRNDLNTVEQESINLTRHKFIQKVQELQDINLKHCDPKLIISRLKQVKSDHGIDESSLNKIMDLVFPTFCLFIKNDFLKASKLDEMGALVLIDKFISPNQIKDFKKFLHTSHECQQMGQFDKIEATLNMYFLIQNFVREKILNSEENIIDIKKQEFFKKTKFHLENLAIKSIEKMNKTFLNKIEHFDLSMNKIGKLEKNFITELTSAKSLNLNENNIRIIDRDLFTGLSNLTELNLSLNPIHFIKPNVFTGLPNLKSLDLSMCRINFINRNSFNGLHNLEMLDLSENFIYEIKSGQFKQLYNLKELNLIDNPLNRIKEKAFNDLNKLEKLSFSLMILDRNSFSQDTFKSLINLKSLKLYDSPIKMISESFFQDLVNLETLDLGTNSISTIKPISFSKLKNLKTLILSGNKLERLNEKCFTGLTSLTKLVLSSNRIRMIKPFLFKELVSLKELDLSGNKIHSIDGDMFGMLEKLEVLSIASNSMHTIAENTFEKLRKIESLDLSDNCIEVIDGKCVNGLDETRLRDVNLKDNVIIRIEQSVLDKFKNVNVDLTNNFIN